MTRTLSVPPHTEVRFKISKGQSDKKKPVEVWGVVSNPGETKVRVELMALNSKEITNLNIEVVDEEMI